MLYIDVRTKEEYDSGHIKDAVLLDIMDIMQGALPEVPKDTEIILYCESGNRAMMAESILKRSGFINVSNGGGIEDVLFAMSKK